MRLQHNLVLSLLSQAIKLQLSFLLGKGAGQGGVRLVMAQVLRRTHLWTDVKVLETLRLQRKKMKIQAGIFP
jgi:hypothetical protein